MALVRKCQSVFTDRYYSCFEIDKSQGPSGRQQTPLGPSFPPPRRDLAVVIHSGGGDVLTPKGPCPAMTERPGPHLRCCNTASAEMNRGRHLPSVYHIIIAAPFQPRIKNVSERFYKVTPSSCFQFSFNRKIKSLRYH